MSISIKISEIQSHRRVAPFFKERGLETSEGSFSGVHPAAVGRPRVIGNIEVWGTIPIDIAEHHR